MMVVSKPWDLVDIGAPNFAMMIKLNFKSKKLSIMMNM